MAFEPLLKAGNVASQIDPQSLWGFPDAIQDGVFAVKERLEDVIEIDLGKVLDDSISALIRGQQKQD